MPWRAPIIKRGRYTLVLQSLAGKSKQYSVMFDPQSKEKQNQKASEEATEDFQLVVKFLLKLR